MSWSENPIREARDARLSLTDLLPSFASELQRLLTAAGEPELSAQVPSLQIIDRCRCGDDICCGTFYTRAKPAVAFGPGHRNVVLTPDDGTVILDVVNGEIAYVEVLDRLDVREMLLALVP